MHISLRIIKITYMTPDTRIHTCQEFLLNNLPNEEVQTQIELLKKDIITLYNGKIRKIEESIEYSLK